MPRRQNHHRTRMSYPQILKSFQQRWFFVFHGAAANQHRPGPLRRQRPSQVLHNRRRRRQIHIELQISGNLHSIRLSANRLQSRAILLRLRKK